MDDKKLQSYIEGNISEKEKGQLAEWLDADEHNMRRFLALRRMYDAMYWLDEGQLTKSNPQTKKHKNHLNRYLKYVAVFCLLAGAGCYHYFISSKQHSIEQAVTTQSIFVPEGQRAEITLTDGTKVWLNARTKATFPAHFSKNERVIELDGEAYFEVKPDQKTPFIVKTGAYEVQVVGTAFNVKAYQQTNSFETSVINGAVDVKDLYTKEKIRLVSDQKAYSENGKLLKNNRLNYDHFLWKEGVIAFENESVKHIFELLELYYDVRIEVKNKMIAADTYTGKFRTKDGVEHVLKVLQIRHRFTYLKNNEKNEIIIY